MRKIGAWFDLVAAHRSIAILIPAILVIAIRVAMLPWTGVPDPMAPDEFSQILAAKTFASGKWTNPTHPMWHHFEAAYVLHEPTYASKYPPGPPLIMALGIVLTGHPWAGVLLAAGLMCGALCWMLQGWVPPRWALAGALLAVARYSLHHYWLSSYWGGSFGAFGGALILGALPRVLRGAGRGSAVAMALGFIVVFVTRPYEGLLFSLVPALVVVRWALRGSRADVRQKLASAIAPIVLVGAIAAAPFLYYNAEVTGSPVKLPYAAYTEQYEPVPHFIWQAERPTPNYRHAELKQYLNFSGQVQQQRTPRAVALRIADILGFPVGGKLRMIAHPKIAANTLFALALTCSLFLVFRDRRMRIPLLMLAVVLVGMAPETWFYDHYAAPAVGLMFLITVQGVRHVAVWKFWRRGAGRALPPILVALALAAVAIYSVALLRFAVHPPQYITVDRPRILAHVLRYPGKHLLVIRFGSRYTIDDGEWIHNEPGIDASRVVFARDMGPERNAELLEYFKDRQVWFVYKSKAPARIYRGLKPPDAALTRAPELSASLR